jgi:hypothetical protein
MWYNTATEIIGGDLMMQHSQGTESQQTKNHKRNIHSWLMGEGWQVGEEYNKETSWVLTATDKGGHKLLVLQPIDKADMIVIQSGVKTSDNIRRHLSEMPNNERKEFYFDLQYSLLQMNVEYANVGDPFELVVTSQRVYSDSLIRDTFIQRVIQVRNAQVMILLKIASLMNEPPIVPSEPPPIGFKTP